jgi:hypothetical protein
VTALVDGLCGEFAGWLERDWSVPAEQATAVARIALGALFSHRLLGSLAPASGSLLKDDEAFVIAWADTFHRALV